MAGVDGKPGYRTEWHKTDSRLTLVDCNYCSWWACWPTHAAHEAAKAHLREKRHAEVSA